MASRTNPHPTPRKRAKKESPKAASSMASRVSRHPEDQPLNRSLHAAKQDEFYTQFIDIQKEVEAYAVGDNANKAKLYELDEMDADHVSAWSKGGDSSAKNCQMLCITHNRAKGNR